MKRTTIKINIRTRDVKEVEVETPAFFKSKFGNKYFALVSNGRGEPVVNEVTKFPCGDYGYFQGNVMDPYHFDGATQITADEYSKEFTKMAESFAQDLDDLIEMVTPVTRESDAVTA
jgi:hypothetical protein